MTYVLGPLFRIVFPNCLGSDNSEGASFGMNSIVEIYRKVYPKWKESDFIDAKGDVYMASRLAGFSMFLHH